MCFLAGFLSSAHGHTQYAHLELTLGALRLYVQSYLLDYRDKNLSSPCHLPQNSFSNCTWIHFHHISLNRIAIFRWRFNHRKIPHPNMDICSVRGIGVAVNVRTSTCERNCFKRSLCLTPKRCSSSITNNPRSANSTSFRQQAMRAN